MGITTQGFGQEGYVLADEQAQSRPPEEAMNFSVGVPLVISLLPAVRHPVQGQLGNIP
jgi:hypothetical protein